MEELRVPTVATAVRINYFDERELEGKIFLPAMAATHTGPTTPQDWMNKGTPFFPFLPAGAAKTLILNKRYVVVLTILQDPIGQHETTGVERKVALECGALQLQGAVMIDMPSEQSRLLDWINRPESFLALKEGDTVHLVQKNRITRLSEIVEEKRVD